MKVLFITRKFPPSVGGMELFASELSTALAGEKEVDLKLVAWGGHGRLKALLIALPSLTARSAWALARGGVDIVHAQDGVLAPIAWLLTRLWRKPYVVVIHGLDATYGNPLFRAVVPAAVRRAGTVFCISQAAADEVLKLGVPPAKVKVVSLGLFDRFDPALGRDEARRQLELPAKAPLLLTVGRLVKRKGVAWFVEEVLPGLVKKYPELIYLVVGEGSQRGAIEAAVEGRRLQAHVRLLGRVSDHDRAAAYRAADVFVMPNVNVPDDVEGFGLVLLEASTYELPVVAADTEGIADAVSDGRNGRLVPVRDAAAFAERIGDFLDEPTRARQFGVASRRFTLERYRWDRIAAQYLAEYRRLLH